MIKSNIEKLIPSFIISFAISFMLYIYEPILTYANNIDDFWFDLKALIVPIIMFFFVSFFILMIIFITIFYINSKFSDKMKVYKLFVFLAYIVFIYIYIQGNFLIGNLPHLDGTTIYWNVYVKDNIVSILTFLSVLFIDYILLKKLKYDKAVKVNEFITLAICIMIVTSLTSILLTNGVFREKIVANATYRNINNASSDKNFFIFLVDAVDSSAFSNIVENSEYASTFENFTYYPDTVSAYLYTRDSIPFIFSGEWNENEKEFNDYYNDAFNNSILIKNLKNKEYDMNFYEYQILWSDRNAQMFSNIDIYNDKIDKIPLFKQLTKYILFKYLPYPLKRFSRIETMNFDSCKVDNESNYFQWDNDIAYNILENNDINIVDNKYFQFIHIEGGHTPFNYDENVNRISEEEGTYEQKLRATLKIINSFIKRLKENNVYDNSAIIIMADHGYWVRR